MKKLLMSGFVATLLAVAVSGAYAQTDMTSLIAAAKKEGTVNSLGMPDDWANWKDTWDQMKAKYGITHQDTDMSSAQEIAKFDA
jgi:putative spermidine/putrescine transport system substrate-binding protein